MKFKKIAALLGAFTIASSLFIAGCGNTVTSQKTWRVGTDATYAPFGFKDKDSGKLAGFDVDIINTIAKEEGIEADVQNLNFDVRQFNLIVDAFLELQNRGVDVVINDTPVNEYYVNGKGKGIAKVTGEDYDAAPLGIAVKKGNTELLNKVNDGLAKIKANGKYAEIYKKWFGKEPPAEDLK